MIDRYSCHVIPLGDHECHFIGMDCWCYPVVAEIIKGRPLVCHNAKDCRESYERITNEGIPGKGWQRVLAPLEDTYPEPIKVM